MLAAIGLAAADVATYKSLRSFLFNRVDSTLNQVHPGVESSLFEQSGGSDEPTVPNDCVELQSASGQVLVHWNCGRAFPGAKVGSPPDVLDPGLASGKREHIEGRPRPLHERRVRRRVDRLSRARVDRGRPSRPGAPHRRAADEREQHAAPPAAHRDARNRGRARRDGRALALDRTNRAAPAARDRGDGDGHHRRRPVAPRRRGGRAHGGRARRLGDQRDARRGSRRPTSGCAGSSRTRRTSCARRSRRCVRTQSSSRAAPRAGRRISPGR